MKTCVLISTSQHMNKHQDCVETWKCHPDTTSHANHIPDNSTPGMNSGHEPELHLIDQLLEAAIKSKVTAKCFIKLFPESYRRVMEGCVEQKQIIRAEM